MSRGLGLLPSPQGRLAVALQGDPASHQSIPKAGRGNASISLAKRTVGYDRSVCCGCSAGLSRIAEYELHVLADEQLPQPILRKP
jgi:hypothetical protein